MPEGVVSRNKPSLKTHYRTTNFRLFQTDRKHYGKRRNCSLRAISPFPKVFSKSLFPRGVKRVIVWEWVKGVYLDFSRLTELKNLYITEIYMKKQYISSIINNHKTTKKEFFYGVSSKGYVASKVIFRFCARNKNKALWEYPMTSEV